MATIRRRRRDLPPSLWGLVTTESGGLARGPHALQSLVAAHGSPLHVVDSDRLERSASIAVKAAGPGFVLANHRTTAASYVGRRLHALGVGAVTSSAYEFGLATSLGAPSDRIVHVAATPLDQTIGDAIRLGTMAVVGSTLHTVRRIVSLATSPASSTPGRPTNVGFGIQLDADDHLGGFAGNIASLVEAIATVQSSSSTRPSMLRVVFSRTIRTDQDARFVAEAVARLILDVHATTGWAPSDVLVAADIGCPTVTRIGVLDARLNRAFASDLAAPSPDDTIDLAAALCSITEGVQHRVGNATTVSFEPGPAMNASSQFTLTTILDVKNDGPVTHLVLDAGINIADQTGNEFHQLFNASCAIGDAHRSYRLVGPICTPADVLYPNWRLPRAEVGDVLAIMDTGAGFANRSTSFSFPRPAIVAVDDAKCWVIRRAETFGDLVGLDRVEWPRSRPHSE